MLPLFDRSLVPQYKAVRWSTDQVGIRIATPVSSLIMPGPNPKSSCRNSPPILNNLNASNVYANMPLKSCLCAMHYAIECVVFDFALNRLRRRASSFDAVYMINLIDRRDFVLVALGYHFVVEGPASAACKFGNNDIAVAEEIDVKVDVMNGLDEVSMAHIGEYRVTHVS